METIIVMAMDGQCCSLYVVEYSKYDVDECFVLSVHPSIQIFGIMSFIDVCKGFVV